ncbi:unnamed protein product [Auanema sp. JU1783]|nr:unnamed protein product [Auanema sp. JU1783]
MAHGRVYKALLALSILIELLFCSALLGVVYYQYFVQDTGVNYLPYTIVIGVFVLLFLIFVIHTAIYIFFKKTERLITINIVLCVCRLLVVFIGAITLFSEDNFSIDDKRFPEDPLSWLYHRKMVVIGGVVALFPIYILQLFVLNRCFSAERKQSLQ